MEETNSTVSQQEWRQQIGESLSASRQAQSLSLAQVAEHLKLRVNQIRQIESGDWADLPGAVFTRGFIRNYSALLGIGDDILPMLDKALPSTAIQMKKSITPPAAASNEKKQRKLLPTWLKIALLGALIITSVYLWQTRSTQQTKQQTEAQLAEDTQVPVPEINHGNVVIVPLPDAQASAVVAASDTAGKTNEASTPAATTAPVAASEPAAHDNTLHINTKYRTFLSVSDAKGETLINQLVPGGSRQQLSGTPPYQIRIGYALGSTVEFNGKSYEMAPYLNGKTANLTVPAP